MSAIIFDLDGTLLHYTKPYEEILSDAFSSVEGKVKDEWIEGYLETFDKLFSNYEANPVERAFTESGVTSEPAPYVAALQEAETRAQEVPKDAYEELKTASREYQIGVLTNGPREWQIEKLRKHDLGRYFDAFVTSYDVGAHKPASAPYEAIENRIIAERYVMIGDHERDINGAERVGWDAHLYSGGSFSDLLQDITKR